MPGEVISVEESERAKGVDVEISEDDRRRRKSRSFKRKAMSASTRITHSLRKRAGKRVADCRFASISIYDVRDAKEEAAVNAFRGTLIQKDLLPPRHDDYHTLLRFLKARKFDLDKTLLMWSEMLNWRKENGVDSIIQDFIYEEYEQEDKVGHFLKLPLTAFSDSQYGNFFAFVYRSTLLMKLSSTSRVPL